MKKLRIERDEYPENPRNDDNLGIIAYKHSRYSVGDVSMSDPIDYLLDLYGIPNKQVDYCNETYQELQGRAEEFGYVLLPVYMYDHGGITISTSPFYCPWDSGQVGFIYTDIKRINNLVGHGWKKWSEKRREKAREWLRGEIELFDQYIRGDVYGFIVEEDGDEIDSCWGFYGEDPRTNGMSDYIDDDELIQQYVNENNL